MRLLLLTHYYPPETHGGTQTYVAALAQRARDRGDDVLVIAGARDMGRAGECEESLDCGIRVMRLFRDPSTEGASGDMGSERLLGEVRALAEAFDPDVAHVHHWHGLSRGLVPLLKGTARRVLVTLHDLFTTCPRFFRMPDARTFCAPDVGFDTCARCVAADLPPMPLEDLETGLAGRFAAFQSELRGADRVLVVSEAHRQLLSSIPGFDFDGMTALPLGIFETFDATGRKEAPRDDTISIVNWAGLDPRKGAHLLLEGVALSGHPERFSIHLHGRDGHEDYMTELRAKATGLDVHWHGPFSEADRAGFADRDLAIFAFLAFETYGIVVDEALALGLPVFTSSHGAPSERLGDRGRAFDAGDPAALASLLDAVLENPRMLADMREGAHRARPLRQHFDALFALYDN